jgi:nicotinamide riboside kinase
LTKSKILYFIKAIRGKKNILTNRRPIKIAIVGPESTGKSTLSVQLSTHYNAAYVPEYARTFIEGLNRPYTLEDIILISKEQLQLEKDAKLNNSNLLFCDTTLLVTKIWAENAFKVCPNFITEKWNSSDYALHLLMQIDLPWEDDPQREHPTSREFFFNWYEKELVESNANYIIISGTQAQRLSNAILAIDNFLKALNI